MFKKTTRKWFFITIMLFVIITLFFIPTIKNQIYSVIMIDAIESGDISKLEKALKKGNPDYVPGNAFFDHITEVPYKRSPLQLACYKGDMDMVKLLIDHGAGVNYVKLNAVYSPLISAIQGQSKNDLNLVKYLIEQGANVNYECNVERPVISWLVNSRHVSKNSTEILKCLVEAGAEQHAMNYLLPVCFWKHDDMIEYFIEECDYSTHGGDIIQQYCRGVNKFSEEIFELLISNGANIYEIDEDGKNAVDYLLETTEGDTYWVDVMKSIYEKHNS